MASVASSYDAALLDLDGTIYEGGAAIPNALEGLTEAALPMVFITNNASRAPQTVADQLNELGYDVHADDVMTSAQAAIEMAAEVIEPGSNVFVLGAESFKQLAREAGYTLVDSADDNPAAVFQGLNREMTWKQMSEAALAVSRGARFLVSNLDTTLPRFRRRRVSRHCRRVSRSRRCSLRPRSAWARRIRWRLVTAWIPTSGAATLQRLIRLWWSRVFPRIWMLSRHPLSTARRSSVLT